MLVGRDEARIAMHWGPQHGPVLTSRCCTQQAGKDAESVLVGSSACTQCLECGQGK